MLDREKRAQPFVQFIVMGIGTSWYSADEAKLWTREKRVPGRLTCSFLRLGVGAIGIPYTKYFKNYNFKLLLEYLSICYYEL